MKQEFKEENEKCNCFVIKLIFPIKCLELRYKKLLIDERKLIGIWKCWKFLIFCEKTELLLSSWPLNMTNIQTSTTFFPQKLKGWLKKLKFTRPNNEIKTSHKFWCFSFKFSRKLHCLKNAATCVEKNTKNFSFSLVFH